MSPQEQLEWARELAETRATELYASEVGSRLEQVYETSNQQLCDQLRESEAKRYLLALERDRWVARVRVLEARLDEIRRALG